MVLKLFDADQKEWDKFGKICVLRNSTIKKQINDFVKRYNKKYGGLLK